MAASQWPRGRWLAMYGAWSGVCRSLAEAKRCVAIHLHMLQRQAGPVRVGIPRNAVIAKVGSVSAYHGRLHGTGERSMYWERVRPADPIRIVAIPPPGKAAQVRRALGIPSKPVTMRPTRDRGRKR